MADPSKMVDQAGMTYVVEAVRLGGTTPGDLGDVVFPSGDVVAAGTGAGSWGTASSTASLVLPVTYNGTTYYIGLKSAN